MKKSYIPVISDTVFFAFCAFLFFLAVLRKTVKSPFSFIFSALMSILLAIAVFMFLSARKNKRRLKAEEKEKAETFLFQLSFMPKSEAVKLFDKAFRFLNKPFKKNGNFYNVLEEKTVYMLSLSANGAGKADVVKLFNKLKKGEKGKIFCLFISDGTQEFCDRFNGKISLLSGEDVYVFLKNAAALPEITVAPVYKKKRRIRKAVVLNKKRAKNYLLFGSGFFLMSFIVRFNAYYIAAGCAFFILSAITLIFGKKENAEE